MSADKITEPIRDRIERRFGSPEESKFMYLITCDWCASFWIAPPVALIAVYHGSNRLAVAAFLALSASHLSGMLAAKEMQ